MRGSGAQIALSLGVLALGAGVAVGTAVLPAQSGYARIGPNFIPAVVAFGLIVAGAFLLYEALSGGWRSLPEPAERTEHALHWGAFAWISAGLVAHMALMQWAGFVLAGAVLFACVARGFGSPRLLRDAAIGIALALGVFFFFVRVLNVGLPGGWLKPLIGGL
ncbi:MAG TPA: tripartite tricarboxylate transporter TctB family protein [Burkholderiales bacterium]|nr:tripartite tricarboxylate transporter TctB family protein [Burkholderiales bacterium]